MTESLTDFPARTLPTNIALLLHRQHRHAAGISPFRWLILVLPGARLPARGRGLDAQRFARTDMIGLASRGRTASPRVAPHSRKTASSVSRTSWAFVLPRCGNASIMRLWSSRITNGPTLAPGRLNSCGPLKSIGHSSLGAPRSNRYVARAGRSSSRIKPRRFNTRCTVRSAINQPGWSRSRSTLSFGAPPSGRSCRNCTILGSISSLIRCGEWCGRRLRSTTCLAPPSC